MSETKLVAIKGGGDWGDASVDFLAVPKGVDLDAAKAAYNVWYRDEYALALRNRALSGALPYPVYLSFPAFLVARYGATENPPDITIFED